jgi:hypothetical protein
MEADLLFNGSAQRALKRAFRVIEALDPAAAREFARVTDIVLRDRMDADAQPCGLLNQTGGPLEFSFSSASEDLRYTMEVGGVETSPDQRLCHVELLLTALGVEPEWNAIAREFATLQRDRQCAWGAWLGGRQPLRHTHDRATRFKIYAEVPSDSNGAASSLLRRYLGVEPFPRGPSVRLVVVGATPGSQRCEFYFEIGSRTVTRAFLRALLDRVGLASRFDDLYSQIRSFAFRYECEPDALPNAQYGFSYSVLPGGCHPVFSVFIFATDLAGGDAGVRDQILTARHLKGTLRGYAAMSEPLARRHFETVSHNMLTFFVDADAPAGLQVSLSPSPPSDNENTEA